MWPRIFRALPAFCAFLFHMGAICGQSDVPKCALDSTPFIQNPRWHYPGEPVIDWLPTPLLDSLIQADFDQFRILAESPRQPRRLVWIECLKSPGGKQALFAPHDLRFISYDPLNRTNHSKSTVTGHTYRTTPFWYEEELHFQNGWTNWIKHAQRLYHSQVTHQIEIKRTVPAPDGVNTALVMAIEEASYFILLNGGNLEDQSGPVEVYSLPHDSEEWTFEGALNSDIAQLRFGSGATVLRDYVAFPTEDKTIVVNKENLAYAAVLSPTLQKVRNSKKVEGRKIANPWRGTRANTMIWGTTTGVIEEDIEKLVEGAEWKPLIVPAPEIAPPTFDLMQRENKGWLAAIALGMLSLFLGFSLLGQSRSQRQKMAPIVIPDGEGQAPLSAMVVQLLGQRGRLLSAAQFDAIVGLDQVHSPETRRSRRARIIQVANTETTARFGHPLVVRTKSETDKRIVLYRIQDLGNLD